MLPRCKNIFCQQEIVPFHPSRGLTEYEPGKKGPWQVLPTLFQARLWPEHLNLIRGKFYVQRRGLEENCPQTCEVWWLEIFFQFLEAVERAGLSPLLYWSICPVPKEEFPSIIVMMLFPFSESLKRLWLIHNNGKLAL